MNQNRFTSYLASQKLAKSLLIGAEEKLRKGDEKGAIHLLIESVRNFQTSTNCLASLAFEPRKKRLSLPKKKKCDHDACVIVPGNECSKE